MCIEYQTKRASLLSQENTKTDNGIKSQHLCNSVKKSNSARLSPFESEMSYNIIYSQINKLDKMIIYRITRLAVCYYNPKVVSENSLWGVVSIRETLVV